jgi:hypothetical protein
LGFVKRSSIPAMACSFQRWLGVVGYEEICYYHSRKLHIFGHKAKHWGGLEGMSGCLAVVVSILGDCGKG